MKYPKVCDYVPEPRPVSGDRIVACHYYPGWKKGQSGIHNSFADLQNYPERTPLLGYYDEANPEVADWEIKWAVDTQEKKGIYAVGASDGTKTGVLISRYFEEDKLPADLPVKLSSKKGSLCGAKLYLIDETHDLAEIPYRTDQDGNLLFDMKANTVVYLEI